MVMFGKLALVGAISALIVGQAQAADIIEPTAFDWTGPYIGLQGGYAWGNNHVDVDSDIEAQANARIITLFPPNGTSFDIDGWLGGLHLGYLWQHDSFVFGIEGDGEFADVDGEEDIFVEADNTEPDGQFEQEIDWLASLRLRAGFAWDRLFAYATGGLAVGGVEASADAGDFWGSDSVNSTEWGWTIGGGLEFAVSEEVSARIEYRYTDLGDTVVRLDDFDFEVDNTFHAVRAGLSWHFDGI